MMPLSFNVTLMNSESMLSKIVDHKITLEKVKGTGPRLKDSIKFRQKGNQSEDFFTKMDFFTKIDVLDQNLITFTYQIQMRNFRRRSPPWYYIRY